MSHEIDIKRLFRAVASPIASMLPNDKKLDRLLAEARGDPESPNTPLARRKNFEDGHDIRIHKGYLNVLQERVMKKFTRICRISLLVEREFHHTFPGGIQLMAHDLNKTSIMIYLDNGLCSHHPKRKKSFVLIKKLPGTEGRRYTDTIITTNYPGYKVLNGREISCNDNELITVCKLGHTEIKFLGIDIRKMSLDIRRATKDIIKIRNKLFRKNKENPISEEFSPLEYLERINKRQDQDQDQDQGQGQDNE